MCIGLSVGLLHVKCRYYCMILVKLELSRQTFENSANIQFDENSFIGSRVVLCGQTDRHDEANGRFLQFCENAYKYQNIR
jgi:hypothetical protein